MEKEKHKGFITSFQFPDRKTFDLWRKCLEELDYKPNERIWNWIVQDLERITLVALELKKLKGEKNE